MSRRKAAPDAAPVEAVAEVPAPEPVSEPVQEAVAEPEQIEDSGPLADMIAFSEGREIEQKDVSPEDAREEGEEETLVSESGPEDEKVYTLTEAQLEHLLGGMDNSDATSQSPEAAISQPEEEPPAQVVAPVVPQIPKLTQEKFDEILSDPDQLHTYLAERDAYTAQAAVQNAIPQLWSIVGEMVNNTLQMQKFLDENPAFAERPQLVAKTINQVRAKNPNLTKSQDVLAKVKDELSFLVDLRANVQKTQASGRKVNVQPKAAALRANANARGLMQPSRPQRTENSFEELVRFANN